MDASLFVMMFMFRLSRGWIYARCQAVTETRTRFLGFSISITTKFVLVGATLLIVASVRVSRMDPLVDCFAK